MKGKLQSHFRVGVKLKKGMGERKEKENSKYGTADVVQNSVTPIILKPSAELAHGPPGAGDHADDVSVPKCGKATSWPRPGKASKAGI